MHLTSTTERIGTLKDQFEQLLPKTTLHEPYV